MNLTALITVAGGSALFWGAVALLNYLVHYISNPLQRFFEQPGLS